MIKQGDINVRFDHLHVNSEYSLKFWSIDHRIIQLNSTVD